MNYVRLIVLICLIGCGLEEVDESDPRVQAAVKEQIDQKVQELRNSCREEIIKTAEFAVDSTLRAQALNEKLSIFNPPAKPTKPIRPHTPKLQDSLEIKPLDKNLPTKHLPIPDSLQKF